MKYLNILTFGLLCSVSAIGTAQEEMYFETLTSERTGITFANQLHENDTFNYLNFQYMYNGGGVAVGDINNDGLSDLYFTGNQVPDKLYLNEGDLKFKDITNKALGKLTGEGWNTGVTMADVNQDGHLDIYVSRSGLENFGELRSNLLYINNGDLTFTESAKEYGIDVSKGTNQSVFFDMDNDGDLDLYCMNRPYKPDFGEEYDLTNFPNSDDLFENVNGKFVNISDKAGIKNRAYGLGIAISDLNNDGYLDIYVSNDYVQPDFCYINQGNNTFIDEIKTRTRHVSHFGMGSDIADFNNDGLVDIMVVDMAMADHVKSKKTMAGMNAEQFWNSIEYGNQYEYMFNTLQLNNGNGTFSEIAQLAGISKTDWSWGPLFADFNNDGLKDLFVTNGYRREVRDNDYIIRLRTMKYETSDYEEVLGMAAETKVPNEMYRNEGDYHFKKAIEDWKLDIPVNSNGGAYADLDNDGDLDIVLNNMEDPSTILENKLNSGNTWLRVKVDEQFEGVKAALYTDKGNFYQEYQPTRGFQSCMEEYIHFGCGTATKGTLILSYPDGRELSIKLDNLNQVVNVKAKDFHNQVSTGPIANPLLPFTALPTLDYKHVEFIMDDFGREVLLPHKMSQLGPFISSGDINGDGLMDFYVSGSRYYKGSMFMQTSEGEFTMIGGPWEQEFEREEQGSTFFDADGDGDLDLYIGSGGNEYIFYSTDPVEIEYNKNLQDQLYINDGQGKFTNETADRLPEMITSTQRVTMGDYDGDGDIDIFVGGRQIPGYYPAPPNSYLLQNAGNGNFVDVTAQSKDLKNPGLVTDALFDDYDGDGDLDLLIAGEWMPIAILKNENGIFKYASEQHGLSKSVGWWMSCAKGDFNKDGKMDYVFGNIGENNKFHPSYDKPLEIYFKDFDQNGTFDIVLAKYQEDICYPVRGRQCSSEQMPFIVNKFPTYDEFATANLSKIYGDGNLANADLHYSAREFASVVLMSQNGGFTIQHLPKEAQMGPLNDLEIDDFNGDGNLDILGVGNNYAAEIETVRYDGGRGVLLLGDGKGGFDAASPVESGFFVNSDAKDMTFADKYLFVTSNNDSLKVFKRNY